MTVIVVIMIYDDYRIGVKENKEQRGRRERKVEKEREGGEEEER
jgi:hypothetical protein